jgi:hypothetical protein
MSLPIPKMISRADALYAARDRRENVLASVELLQSLPTPQDYETCWRLGRALFFLGQEEQAQTEARAFHEQAAVVCRRAARLEPRRVEGHFWLGVNLALLAQLEKRFAALCHALLARRALKRAVRLDPAYHAAGPLRVLARLEHKLPGLLGGSLERSRQHFEKAIGLAPENTVTRIYFAELLLDMTETARARQELEAILQTAADPAWAFETARDKRLADELLKRIADE